MSELAERASLPPPTVASVYGWPLVGRYGLAHSLVAWARCELWCKDHRVPMLAPNWNYLRVGPYLRRESDKREYHRLFRFQRYVTGLKRGWLWATLPRRPVAEISNGGFDMGAAQLIVFENLMSDNFETYFHELSGRAPEVHAALREMTKPKFLPAPADTPHIAIHVRLGDFSHGVDESALRQGHKNSSLPISWYVQALQKLRAALGTDVPTLIYSDGSDAALAPLLKLPRTRRAVRAAAITDLLSIAQASALISSGSGFSAFGGFLGQVPRVCFPGQRLVRALGAPTPTDLEPELDFEQSFEDDFVRAIASRIAAPVAPAIPSAPRAIPARARAK